MLSRFIHTRGRRFCVAAAFLVVYFAAGNPRGAFAHDVGLSFGNLRVQGGSLFVQLTFARPDIDRLLISKPIDMIASELIDAQCDDRDLGPAQFDANVDVSDAITFRAQLPIKACSIVHIRSALIEELSFGHRQYIRLDNSKGDSVFERVLDARNDTVEFDQTQLQGSRSTRQAFLLLGIRHILTGYDHLVFLLGILLSCRTLASCFRSVTAFTLSHSLTLALSSAGIVHFPPRLVEALIAVSIVYIGLENVLRPTIHGRWKLTFMFGLVHGLGFASALTELTAGSQFGLVTPLLLFNSGVEIGQIAAASLAAPLLWSLRSRFDRKVTSSCGIVVTIAGFYWLAQRILPG
jgi:hydrogenase/urease accessory protein HupE